VKRKIKTAAPALMAKSQKNPSMIPGESSFIQPQVGKSGQQTAVLCFAKMSGEFALVCQL